MLTRSLFALFCAALCCLADQNDDHWEQWKVKHSKQYHNSDVEAKRRAIWDDNAATINEHNKRHDLGLESYRMGLNHFGDMTFDELSDIYLKSYDPAAIQYDNVDVVETVGEIPENFDWRTKGAVTDIKNQGQCGSCYTFATCATLEGQWFLKTNQSVSLSEQQLVDCTYGQGNAGCNGGNAYYCYHYLTSHSIESYATYPYTAKLDTCKYNESKGIFNLTGKVTTCPQGHEWILAYLVYSQGPAAVAIDVVSSFFWYSSGIYTSTKCSSTQLNHAVTAVGYGVSDDGDYWIIKNSWGAYWGNKGYILMARNKNNMCGIATQGTIPQLH